tara:strand:- start:476 stop:661 length:186 start_codon:yes stop_codon:yes gene_type:complete
MSKVHEKIEKILEDFANQEVNLSSAAARKIVSQRIVSECLSKSKSIMLEEIDQLKPQLRCT